MVALRLRSRAVKKPRGNMQDQELRGKPKCDLGLECPFCHSRRLRRDGMSHHCEPAVQRYYCPDCKHRTTRPIKIKRGLMRIFKQKEN